MSKAGIAAHVGVSAVLRGLGAADATNSFIYSWLHGMLGAEELLVPSMEAVRSTACERRLGARCK